MQNLNTILDNSRKIQVKRDTPAKLLITGASISNILSVVLST